jgi:hypothetical protein
MNGSIGQKNMSVSSLETRKYRIEFDYANVFCIE